MKLSEIKGEKALDVLADLIEPVAKVLADGEVARLYKSGKPKLLLAKYVIKEYKREVINVLAIIDGEDPKEYVNKINLFTLPVKLLDLLNDEDLVNFFQSQVQNQEENFSGSATENTEAQEK